MWPTRPSARACPSTKPRQQSRRKHPAPGCRPVSRRDRAVPRREYRPHRKARADRAQEPAPIGRGRVARWLFHPARGAGAAPQFPTIDDETDLPPSRGPRVIPTRDDLPTRIITGAIHEGTPSPRDLAVARTLQQVWLSALIGWVGGVDDAPRVVSDLEAATQLLLGDA